MNNHFHGLLLLGGLLCYGSGVLCSLFRVCFRRTGRVFFLHLSISPAASSLLGLLDWHPNFSGSPKEDNSIRRTQRSLPSIPLRGFRLASSHSFSDFHQRTATPREHSFAPSLRRFLSRRSFTFLHRPPPNHKKCSYRRAFHFLSPNFCAPDCACATTSHSTQRPKEGQERIPRRFRAPSCHFLI